MPNKDKIVGFTCGSFDLCHAGHCLMFKECKEYCDYLVIGLQKDPSIDRSEKNKPVQDYKERLIILESIRYIDDIIVYETEEELYQILNNMWETGRIDVRIIGADWKGKEFTGHDLPISVKFNSRTHEYSTSELRERVYNTFSKKENC